jgi:RNase P/RNase MRP subunit p29
LSGIDEILLFKGKLTLEVSIRHKLVGKDANVLGKHRQSVMGIEVLDSAFT